jgi:hypothetical protein
MNVPEKLKKILETRSNGVNGGIEQVLSHSILRFIRSPAFQRFFARAQTIQGLNADC